MDNLIPKPRRLTLKQRQFAKNYVENKGNGLQAAIKVYDTKDINTATVIASENLRKPNVANEINEILDRNGLTDDEISVKIATAMNSGLGVKATNSDALRALDMIVKMKGLYAPSRSLNASVNLTEAYKDKSHQELIKELELSNEKNKKLLDDLGTS